MHCNQCDVTSSDEATYTCKQLHKGFVLTACDGSRGKKIYCKLLEYSKGKGTKTQAGLLWTRCRSCVKYVLCYTIMQSVPSCRQQSLFGANRTAKCCGLRFSGSKSQGCHWSAVSSTPNCRDEVSSSVAAACTTSKTHSKIHSRSCKEVVHDQVLSYLIYVDCALGQAIALVLRQPH